MKKTILAAAILLASTAAMAQSSVTLYGLMDAGVTYTNNVGGGHQFSAGDGANNQSYFGLKGSEDLGDGVKAVFDLEQGFSIGNGSEARSGQQFSRQAYLGLSSDKLGTLTLGRQYATFSDFLGPLSYTGSDIGGAGSHPFNNDGLNTDTVSVNNSVKYLSNSYNGFQFGGQYGFSNGNASRQYSLAASYQYKDLTVAAGYEQTNNAGNVGGAISDTDAAFVGGRSQTWGVGANYAFNKATVGVLVTQTRLSGVEAIGGQAAGMNANVALTNGDARFTNYEVNGKYQLTPALTVGGAYTFTDARIDGVSPKFNQVTAQVDYALSKRTDVYVVGQYQHVNNTGNSGITADINGLSASATDSQVSATVGLRHRF